MSVRVIIPSMFQSATDGAAEIELSDCVTIGECFQELRMRYPSLGKMLFDEGDSISSFLNVFVNGQRLGQGNDTYESPVEDGDDIYPIMMIAGG